MNAPAKVFGNDTGIEPGEIERVRKEFVGQKLRLLQFNTEASIDNIRHYAHGCGDDNPLWSDPDYAAKGPYGGIVAPPTFYYTIFSPGITPGFDGLQVFFGTGTWDIERLPRRGETIIPEAKLVDMYEVKGKTAKHMVVQVGETIYRTPEGELLATYLHKGLRVPRSTQKDGLKYEPRKAYRYSQEEIDNIRDYVVFEQKRRGSEILYFEDVQVGDELPKVVKGPLNSTTITAYYAGNLSGAGYRAAEMQWRTRWAAVHAPETLPNNRSFGWLAEETWPGMGHFDGNVAESVGMPGAYDNGWMRLAWVGQVATDWMGDHGFLKRLEVRHLLPNLLGDTLWIGGTVTAKRVEGDKHIVSLDLFADNQIGQRSCKGSAEVVLLSRDKK